MCPLPLPNKTRKFGVGGHLSPVPRLEYAPPPPSPILLLLPLQIPCSLITKLISNSCAPPPPTRLREIKKRTPVPRLLPCWANVIWLGVNDSGTYSYAQFFLRCGLVFFKHFFFLQSLSPLPLTMALLFFLTLG